MDMPCNERAMWAKNELFDSTDTTKMLLKWVPNYFLLYLEERLFSIL